jgi:hypothetical protein|tara:strand:+ start:110 stop:304 length:195 start_codon:yes stop_codon:yes gene_type:complete
MGHLYLEKINQINCLIELYEEYENTQSENDRILATRAILKELQSIRNWELNLEEDYEEEEDDAS